jgi:lysophospholipase L1-like esterase
MAAALLLAPIPAARAGTPGGIGVLGDSYSDEYQFYPPDRSTARNWVEILAATRGLDFGRFSDEGRGEPRNRGFAYNWARSDATSADLIAAGQHTGLAAQVARGEVRIVVIFVGGNDFINALRSPEPEAALAAALPRALANHRLAVATLLDAHPEARLILATLPDIRHLPEFAGPIAEGRLPRRVAAASTAAIGRFNAQVRALAAADPRIALADLDLATKAANLISTDYALVDGRWIDRRRPANDLEHLFLADVRHPGTLGQGLLARAFVDVLNAEFGAGIEPLGDAELVSFARSLAAPAPGDSGARLAGLR